MKILLFLGFGIALGLVYRWIKRVQLPEPWKGGLLSLLAFTLIVVDFVP